MAQSPLFGVKPLFNKTLPISRDELAFLQVQRFPDEPAEVVVKHSKREESGRILTLESIHFPLCQASALADALKDVENEALLDREIEGPLNELFKKFGRERVANAFLRVQRSRVGLPE
ncbi:MAG TPA: hypothetical protein VJ249_09705 [Candidatus Bathyarchaeia archaeon]|nr:hypothetical protein [Candidatus Bathyarchaeia archaeon]